MDGFHFIQSTTCVIFLFQSWVLDTGGKYALAFLGTLLLGIGLEKLIQQRRKVMAIMTAGRKRLVVSATFYGVQLTIGYMLMLVIMIYAGALFIATILGLVIGHVLFNAQDAIWPLPVRAASTLGVIPGDGPYDHDDDDDGTDHEESHAEISEQTLAPAASANCPVEMTTELTNQSTRSSMMSPKNNNNNNMNKKDWEADTTDTVENTNSCCGISNHGSTTDTNNGPKEHLIPEGSTPCCQYSSCD
jgi:hypothetical protein